MATDPPTLTSGQTIDLRQMMLYTNGFNLCSPPELAVWGTLSFMLSGDWQRIGCFPPRCLSGITPKTTTTIEELATILGTTQERIRELLTGLIEKGALTWH